MSIGQDIFIEVVTSIWKFTKGERSRKRVARMTREEFDQWRVLQFAKIREEATRLSGLSAGHFRIKDITKYGIEHPDLVRACEVLLRNDLGMKMGRNLLEGMDLRGLDLRKVRGLDQGQIDLALGDHSTRLPGYLKIPAAWENTASSSLPAAEGVAAAD